VCEHNNLQQILGTTTALLRVVALDTALRYLFGLKIFEFSNAHFGTTERFPQQHQLIEFEFPVLVEANFVIGHTEPSVRLP
jgi:hypothetical protein